MTMPREGSREIGAGIVCAIAPDVCLTPIGPIIVPIPYPLVAFQNISPAGLASSVRQTGLASHVKASIITKSFGDEPGVCGGVVSGTVGSKCTPKTHSSTVKAEGRDMVRFDDLWLMNKKNTIGKLIFTMNTCCFPKPINSTCGGSFCDGLRITGGGSCTVSFPCVSIGGIIGVIIQAILTCQAIAIKIVGAVLTCIRIDIFIWWIIKGCGPCKPVVDQICKCKHWRCRCCKHRPHCDPGKCCCHKDKECNHVPHICTCGCTDGSCNCNHKPPCTCGCTDGSCNCNHKPPCTCGCTDGSCNCNHKPPCTCGCTDGSCNCNHKPPCTCGCTDGSCNCNHKPGGCNCGCTDGTCTCPEKPGTCTCCGGSGGSCTCNQGECCKHCGGHGGNCTCPPKPGTCTCCGGTGGSCTCNQGECCKHCGGHGGNCTCPPKPGTCTCCGGTGGSCTCNQGECCKHCGGHGGNCTCNQKPGTCNCCGAPNGSCNCHQGECCKHCGGHGGNCTCNQKPGTCNCCGAPNGSCNCHQGECCKHCGGHGGNCSCSHGGQTECPPDKIGGNPGHTIIGGGNAHCPPDKGGGSHGVIGGDKDCLPGKGGSSGGHGSKIAIGGIIGLVGAAIVAASEEDKAESQAGGVVVDCDEDPANGQSGSKDCPPDKVASGQTGHKVIKSASTSSSVSASRSTVTVAAASSTTVKASSSIQSSSQTGNIHVVSDRLHQEKMASYQTAAVVPPAPVVREVPPAVGLNKSCPIEMSWQQNGVVGPDCNSRAQAVRDYADQMCKQDKPMKLDFKLM